MASDCTCQLTSVDVIGPPGPPPICSCGRTNLTSSPPRPPVPRYSRYDHGRMRQPSAQCSYQGRPVPSSPPLPAPDQYFN